MRVTTPARQTEASLAAGVGLTRLCMLSKVMIERGHVDTRNRVMTLVCINVTWGTTVQFVQVCTRLVDLGAAVVVTGAAGALRWSSITPSLRPRAAAVGSKRSARKPNPAGPEFEMRREESSRAEGWPL